jgi:acetate kinase
MDAESFLKKHVGVFKNFGADRLRQLVKGSRVRSFEAEEAILHRGDEATHFGVVLTGQISADVGQGQHLGELNAGDTFGELSLMSGQPEFASFVAKSTCQVLLIPVSLFQSIIVAEPGAVQTISRTIAEREENDSV